MLEIAGGDLEEVRLSIQHLAEEAGDGSHEPVPPVRDRYEPFHVDVLPEPVRSYINESAAAIGCDPAFVALPLLSALAAAIGNAFFALTGVRLRELPFTPDRVLAALA